MNEFTLSKYRVALATYSKRGQTSISVSFQLAEFFPFN